jgi:hypothetical protein
MHAHKKLNPNKTKEERDYEVFTEIKKSGYLDTLFRQEKETKKDPEYKNIIDKAKQCSLDHMVTRLKRYQACGEDYYYYIAYVIRLSASGNIEISTIGLPTNLKDKKEIAKLPTHIQKKYQSIEAKHGKNATYEQIRDFFEDSCKPELKPQPETREDLINKMLELTLNVALPHHKLEQNEQEIFKTLPTDLQETNEETLDEMIRDGMLFNLKEKIKYLLENKRCPQLFLDEMPLLPKIDIFKHTLDHLKKKKVDYGNDAHDYIIVKFILVLNLHHRKKLIDLVQKAQKDFLKMNTCSQTFFVQSRDPSIIRKVDKQDTRLGNPLKVDKQRKTLGDPLLELKRIVDELKNKPTHLGDLPINLRKLKTIPKDTTFWQVIHDGFTQGHGELFLSILKENGAYDVLFPSLTQDIHKKQGNDAWFEEKIKQIDYAYKQYQPQNTTMFSPKPVRFYSTIIQTSLVAKELASNNPEEMQTICQTYQISHPLDQKFKERANKLHGKKADFLERQQRPSHSHASQQ